MYRRSFGEAAMKVRVIALASLALLVGEDRTRAQSALPPAQEPQLADPGDRYAVYNQAQIACYRGSMKACDSLGLNDRILMDSFLGQYGGSCGGRVNLRAMRRSDHTCTTAFPGND
jgi:hypothetical protein